MPGIFRPGRHLPLLLALVAMFAIYPLMLELGRVPLMRLGFLVVLLFAVYGLVGRERAVRWGVALLVPAAAAQLLALASPSRSVVLAAAVLGLVFVAYVTLAVLRSVFAAGRVTGDRIAGAIAVYLLVGLSWALAYGIVGIVDPGAFAGHQTEGEPLPLAEIEYGLVYYSFVTLTTLGYGEIVPVSAVARTLAWMEAVMGQLFMAILVARLVGLHVVHSTAQNASTGDD